VPERTRQAMYVWRIIGVYLRHFCCRGKAISTRYCRMFVCILACYPARKPYLIGALLCCDLWPVWLYHIFPHYLIRVTIFIKKWLNIKYVFWSSLQGLSEKFLILRRNQLDIIINEHRSSRKVPVILVKCLMKL